MQLALKKSFKQAFLFLAMALVAGFLRQWLPQGLSWHGQWPTASTSAKDAYQMVAEGEDPPFVSLQEVIEAQKDKSSLFLDARDSKAFQAGRIPGARNLPFYEMDRTYEAALKGTDTGSYLIVYCEGVGCELSLFLARELQLMGYTKIGIFYGGYPAWTQAGLPVEK